MNLPVNGGFLYFSWVVNYISISLYRKLLSQAMAEGMSDFANLPISPEECAQLEAVPSEVFFELHEILDDALGPGFSIRVGQAMKIEDYGVLGLSWRTCSWAGEIFDRCERYFKLLSDTYVFRVDKKPTVSDIYLIREAHRRGVELSNEATFSATVVVLQAMTETGITPESVSFQHEPPTDLKDYHAAFGCPVLFNTNDNIITYRTKDLETRTAKADEAINRFLVERIEEEVSGIERTAYKVSRDVEELIRDALPSGIPGIDQMSGQLGMSSRTLNRRLSENGQSFRDLVRYVQESRAKELLSTSDRSVAQIAFETGFAEQSSFNRAFKRWTGCTPAEFRRQ